MHVSMAIRGSSLMNSAPANARKRTRPVLTFFTISRQGDPGRDGKPWGSR
jgi:hypothetical protein